MISPLHSREPSTARVVRVYVSGCSPREEHDSLPFLSLRIVAGACSATAPPRGSHFHYSGDFRFPALLSNEDLATDAISVASHMSPRVPDPAWYARKTHKASQGVGSGAYGDILCASWPCYNGDLPSTSPSLVGSEGLSTPCVGKLGRNKRTERYDPSSPPTIPWAGRK